MVQFNKVMKMNKYIILIAIICVAIFMYIGDYEKISMDEYIMGCDGKITSSLEIGFLMNRLTIRCDHDV